MRLAAPLFRVLTPLLSVAIPSSSSLYFVSSVVVPSESSLAPSTSFSAESVSSLMESLRSSSPSMSSVSRESRISVIPKVNVELMLKSVTSASIVNPSGISISRSLSTLLRSRLSESPGRPTPTAMFLCPSESTFPLSIVTFVKLSTGRIIAVTITNGEYISVFFLPTFTLFLALLVYFTSILRCPLLPARSSGLTWTPSR